MANAWASCPICDTKNPPRTSRCSSCGADFADPDVRAMANVSARDVPGPGAAGALASNKFLGISIDSLCDGSGLRRLGIAGAVAMAIGFAVPMAPDYGWTRARWPWEMLSGGPWVSLLYPLVAAAVGLAAIFLRNLSRVTRAAMLTGAGLGGLVFCLPGLGEFAGTPSRLMPLLSVGLAAAGAALVVRSVDPQSTRARKTLAAGAVLAVVGLLIPLANAYQFLPAELRFFVDTDALGSASPLGAYLEAFNRDPLVFFTGLYLLLPALVLPVAAVVAWPAPTGPWDRSGLALRPMAAIMLLYVPLGFALYLFNLMGLSDNTLVYIEGEVLSFDQFSRKLMIGRTKLLVLGGAFAMWAQLGGVVLLRAKSDRSQPDDRTRRSGSESAAD